MFYWFEGGAKGARIIWIIGWLGNFLIQIMVSVSTFEVVKQYFKWSNVKCSAIIPLGVLRN